MILFSDKREECEPLYHMDLQYMGKQLNAFVQTYSRLITVEDPEIGKTLNTLKDISKRLIDGQYETLISDPSIVKDEEPPEDHYPY